MNSTSEHVVDSVHFIGGGGWSSGVEVIFSYFQIRKKGVGKKINNQLVSEEHTQNTANFVLYSMAREDLDKFL